MAGHHDVRVMPLAALKPAPYNPRVISQDAMAGLTKSLERFGLVEPVIWNQRSGYIVGGHQRVAALQNSGAVEAQVIVVDLSPKDEKELNIALNNLSGDWDYDKLKEMLADLKPQGDDRLLLGFSEKELDALLAWGVEMSKPPEDEPGRTIEERKQVFDNATIKQIVLYFQTDQYVDVLQKLKEICEERGLETNSDVFMLLLETYYESHTRPAKTV